MKFLRVLETAVLSLLVMAFISWGSVFIYQRVQMQTIIAQQLNQLQQQLNQVNQQRQVPPQVQGK